MVFIKTFLASTFLVDGEFLMNLGKLFGKEDQKELVDPYCVVSYAGHSGSTPTVKENMNPEWNTQINLGVRVRTRTDRLYSHAPHIACRSVLAHSRTHVKYIITYNALHFKCKIVGLLMVCCHVMAMG